MKPYIAESLSLLHHFHDYRTLVQFSGGKDSIVTLHLAKLAGLSFDASYTFTGIDPPEIVSFIRRNYPSVFILRPKHSFWHLIQTKNPPLMNMRWCCTELKKRPSWTLPHIHRIMGIRAEESPKRRAYPSIDYNRKLHHFHVYPIHHWLEWQVWEFIEEYHLPYPSLYDEGFSRIGCCICPYHSSPNGKLHALYRSRYPGMFKTFEHAVSSWYFKRVAQGRTMQHTSPEAFLSDWYKGPTRWYTLAQT
jgi:phosphoadenosine phosphosulfate reductase